MWCALLPINDIVLISLQFPCNRHWVYTRFYLLVLAEPRGWLQQAEALDHDWRPPPVAPCYQEHGLPEVLKHGAVSLHSIRAPGSSHHRPGCSGSCTSKVVAQAELEASATVCQVYSPLLERFQKPLKRLLFCFTACVTCITGAINTWGTCLMSSSCLSSRSRTLVWPLTSSWLMWKTSMEWENQSPILTSTRSVNSCKHLWTTAHQKYKTEYLTWRVL